MSYSSKKFDQKENVRLVVMREQRRGWVLYDDWIRYEAIAGKVFSKHNEF